MEQRAHLRLLPALELPSRQEAEMVAEYLNQSGIPAAVQVEAASLDGRGRPAWVLVVSERVEEARRLFRAAAAVPREGAEQTSSVAPSVAGGEPEGDASEEGVRDEDPLQEGEEGEGVEPLSPSYVGPLFVWPLMLSAMHLALLVLSRSVDGAQRMRRLGATVLEWPVAEPWRLLTGTFLHSDLNHFLWNTAWLLPLGVGAVSQFGPGRASFLYLLTGLAGSLASAAFFRSGELGVGASGAIDGLLGALLMSKLLLSRHRVLPRNERLKIAGIALLVLPGFFQANFVGHLTGWTSGLLLALVMAPWSEPVPAGFRRRGAALAVVSLVLFLAAWSAAILSYRSSQGS